MSAKRRFRLESLLEGGLGAGKTLRARVTMKGLLQRLASYGISSRPAPFSSREVDPGDMSAGSAFQDSETKRGWRTWCSTMLAIWMVGGDGVKARCWSDASIVLPEGLGLQGRRVRQGARPFALQPMYDRRIKQRLSDVLIQPLLNPTR